MHCAVGLLLGPSRSGDEQELGIRTDGLLILFGCAEASHLGAQRRQLHRDGNLIHLRVPGFSGIRLVRPGIQKQEPRPRGACDHGFDALAIEPARGLNGLRAGESSNVGINHAADAERHSRHHPRKARALRCNHNRGLRGAAQSLARRRIGGKSRLRKRLALHRKQSRSSILDRARNAVRIGGHNPNR